ncbi:hypothetical protein A2943_03335 [Candidatus Adlerbacteria bacterium RIFCSPLOWO2_01_FULL_51_16]|uniref:HEPN domain-containing protein n=1 Tax=Candidatus Adlerbacteria bacterium RIFCSPLOWO2_01_FULL_51_16 TaxID=1797243 RepID=A0A1F4XEL7_9BACT|nr:MAG: hypothetical protein A2943_03335 [Candidatus Adlerbacteria bacterium RIFCSPLOWO2_01_FULL_51_16]
MSEEPLFDNFFENFTHSCATARMLLQKAHDQGNLIEGLILYAALTDAFLRNMVAIKTGTKTSGHKSLRLDDIALDEAFFFHDEKRWFTERQIFQMALETEVIDENEFKQLNELYSFRNRIVHRFITSYVSYGDLAPKLVEYEGLYNNFFKKLEAMEKGPPISDEERNAMHKRILRKIGRQLKETGTET